MIVRPVMAFAVKVGPQESVEARSADMHVGIRFARGVVALIMLARWLQRGQCGVELRPGITARARRSGEWCAHECHASEDVGMEQGAPRGHWRTKIMTHNGSDALILKRCEQGADVAHQAVQSK